MELKICATVNGEYGSYVACKNIPDYQIKCFKPLRISDDAMASYISGDCLAGSLEAEIVIKTREDTAEQIAKELAKMIVHYMKKNDTYNGYRKGD